MRLDAPVPRRLLGFGDGSGFDVPGLEDDGGEFGAHLFGGGVAAAVGVEDGGHIRVRAVGGVVDFLGGLGLDAGPAAAEVGAFVDGDGELLEPAVDLPGA